MSKTIKLERRELVWEYYDVEWTEQDWNQLKEYYKGRAEESFEGEESRWHKNNVVTYNAIKDISWDEAWADFQKWRDGEEGTIYWEEDHSWTDCNDEYHENKYKQYLGDFIEEQIRQDCWNSGPVDCDGADDYDEDWYFEGEDEKETD